MKQPAIPQELHTDEFSLLLVRKAIRHIYLRVCPQTGKIRVSAPHQVSEAAILEAVAHKRDWLHRQSAILKARYKSLEYTDGERHLFLGREYSLKIRKGAGAGQVALNTAGEIEMLLPAEAGPAYRKNLLRRWYRNELLRLAEGLRTAWQEKMGVAAAELRVRSMRTRWGSCNTLKRRIWLNLELAKKKQACIEYVLVHELAHLIERGHTKKFWAVVEKHLPHWRQLRAELNAPMRS